MSIYENKKLALLIPTCGYVFPYFMKKLLAVTNYAWSRGFRIEQIGVTERLLVHSARNVLAKGFMDTDCDWALWVDDDNILPYNAIPKLFETAEKLQATFVTGVYYQRLPPHNPVLWRKDPETLSGTKLYSKDNKDSTSDIYSHHYISPQLNAKKPFKADVCGFGCVLMHRSVLENMEKPWFKMISDVCSEDFYFCVNAKKAGIQLWADPTLDLGHLGKNKEVRRKDYFEYVEENKGEFEQIKLT